MRKVVPFIPILGIPLSLYFMLVRLRDVGLESSVIAFSSAVVQGQSIAHIYLYLIQ